jgi:hypothetical protein
MKGLYVNLDNRLFFYMHNYIFFRLRSYLSNVFKIYDYSNNFVYHMRILLSDTERTITEPCVYYIMVVLNQRRRKLLSEVSIEVMVELMVRFISYVFMDFIRLFSQDVFMEEGYISPRRLVIQRSIQVQMKEKKNECFIVVFLLAVVRVSHDILIILKNFLIVLVGNSQLCEPEGNYQDKNNSLLIILF